MHVWHTLYIQNYYNNNNRCDAMQCAELNKKAILKFPLLKTN